MIPIASTSADPGPSFDYTEGASASDIGEVIDSNRVQRQGSHYSSYYDGEGDAAMFSGPGHTVNPSSVSRMTYMELGRRSLDARPSRVSRRDSWESRITRHSVDGYTRRDGTEDTQSLLSDDMDQRKRRSPSPPPRSMFENLAHIFGRQSSEVSRDRRAPSVSERSSTSRFSRRTELSDGIETEEERWGYSSGEEDSDNESIHSHESNNDKVSITQSMNYDSEPPSPLQASQTLPLLGFDSVFDGEARIDMDTTFTLDPPPPGPPSRQTMYISDEDSTIRFIGYETIPWRVWVWRISCVVTFGIVGFLGRWFPYIWLRWVAREKAFIDAINGFVIVESSHRAVTLLPMQIIKYVYPVTTVFPETIITESMSVIPCNGTYSVKSGLLDNLRVVDYRYNRFALDPRTGLFTMVREWTDSQWTSVNAVQIGVDDSTQQQRLTLFNKNEIDIEGKSTVSLLVEEIIHPFYVFQIASFILWALDDYYYYAFCIALISIISIATTLIETKKTIGRMREMSRFSCLVVVLRSESWTTCDSTDLVPGDIIDLSTSQLSIVPADIFLLCGDAIINESMLTGESVPVSKAAAKDEDILKWKDEKLENPKAFLYGGTRVVRIRGIMTSVGQERPSLGLVARTGFNTTKGALVRSILFPKPIGFKFYRDSVRFIGVLAGIAILGFGFSAVEFVRMGLPWQTILVRALDLVTVVVPPGLPAALSIGTSFALSRLRSHNIFCISPSRVNVAGKINVCCFDKTGTLTEDGLDILGARSLERNVHRFGELLDDVHDLPLTREKATFLHALATCHSLKKVDGEIIGDPLDVKMFGFTKWTLEEGRIGTGSIKAKGTVIEQTALVQTVVRPQGSAQFRVEDALKGASKHAHFLELGVIRTFDFVSSLRRMSVIVKRLRSSSMEVYVKGAPEVMVEICDKSSLPDDYDDLLNYYTKRGYRVIAIAGKSIEGLSWLKAQRMKRDQAESALKFLGLVIFENRLKPGTTPAIQSLRSAHLACRMITGDNALTAVSVARECSLLNQAAHVFSPSFARGNSESPTAKLAWSCLDDPSWKLDSYSLKPLPAPPHHAVEGTGINYQDFSLVVTGDVFRWMINYAPLETLQRMLVKTQVFARMSPDEKNEVVERLQALGYTVLMCGDGANDCAALKAADIGISLSEAEASVAAPFTAGTPDISCVIELIKEGRAALVTSFSCFKYIALYSMIQFTTVTLLYSFASSLGDLQFLYIDLFIIPPIAIAMGRTLPFPRIYLKRPTASLMSKKVLASIIGQIAITSAIQWWAFFWVRGRDWYLPLRHTLTKGTKLQSKNYENTVLFSISCFQYILVAAVFNIGPPYRKPMRTNGWLMFSMSLLTALSILLLLAPPEMAMKALELMWMPLSGRYTLLLVAAINAGLSLAFEEWGTQGVGFVIGWVMGWLQQRRWRTGQKAAYKLVEGGMR